MAAAVWCTARLLEARFGVTGLHAQGLSALLPVALGVVVYLGCASLFRAPELGPLAAGVRARFGRKRAAL